uniref:Cilia and flagella associated protein 61 n=1 Tax=Scleropages formosus TaxID=113540 RepID=A0A8C9TSL2_SCLFO
MKSITSLHGKVETVGVRRTESADAPDINSLITPSTADVFGRVHVIYLLEQANLAVTLTNTSNELLAHAAFLNHPNVDFVDQACWEPWFCEQFGADKCTPLNTLFMHLFVALPEFSILHKLGECVHLCRLFPEPALAELFEPLACLQDPESPCSAFVCLRHNHVPRLHIRRARVEDHDDLTPILAEHASMLNASYGPYFLADLIEAQDEDHHAAVSQDEGTAVGFISASAEVNLKLLSQCFELAPFDRLCKPAPEGPTEMEPGLDIAALPQEPDADSLSDQEVAWRRDALKNKYRHMREGTGNLLSAPISLCATYRAGQGAPPAPVTTSPSPAHVPDARHSFFLSPSVFIHRSVDFLPYMFALFPDRDFCVISVPMMVPEFPLLKRFLRVTPRPASSLPHELYICHRSSLLTCVRPPPSSTQHHDSHGTPLQAFVAVVQEQVVGTAIIRNEEDIEYIRSHYNIESFIYFSHHQREDHGQLSHFALNPIFQYYARHFLGEALRLGHKSCLYYPIYPPHQIIKNGFNASAHSLTWALGCMVPVRPRRQIVYPLEELGINAPPAQVSKEEVPYALNHFSRKLTMEPKLTINSRIVVVGASDTGMSFLEVLSFCPHLRFNNLILISTHGFPDSGINENMRFLSTSHSYSAQDHAQLSLRSRVHVVAGKIISIDRAAKHVVVSGGCQVAYDHLVLCTGQQYQVPCPTGVDISQQVTNSDAEVQRSQWYRWPVPSNLLTLNDNHDCQIAYHWLLENFIDGEGNVVIYGNSIDAYTCVEALLCMGVSGSRIHLVHLPTDSPGSCFNNPTVERAVTEALNKRGVTVYENCLLAQVNDGQDPEPITAVSFTTNKEALRMECSVFMNFSRKGVDHDTFRVLNDACLVYDGGLIIDTAFLTNDPAIRAAGPLTKFARRYYADSWEHAHFNSKEVGQALAAALLPLFDPTLEPTSNLPEGMDRLVLIYADAKIQGGKLPGGYSYLQVAKPAICMPLVAQPSPAKHGQEMVTGSIEAGKYFCLYVNQHGVVESITCLSLKPIPVSNYLCLYGKHEQLLNRLCDRFDEGLIHDFYSYFKEPWCLAVYHDRFADFEEEVRQIMESAKVQLVQKVLNEEAVSENPKIYLKNIFQKSDSITTLKKSMLNYLNYNRYHLTMYAQPGLI